VDEQAELERRAKAGQELTVGEVAKLVGLSRSTIHYKAERGELTFTKTSEGGWRRIDPASVLALLRERRRKYHETPEEMMESGPVKRAALDALRTRERGEPPPSPE
jgi:excisionase family DNA binding protein